MAYPSRREFLRRTSAAGGAAMLGLTLPQFLTACREAEDARMAGAAFKVLTAEEVQEFEAIAAAILPTTDTPGAREAGAIYFIDNVLANSRADMLGEMREGLADVTSRARSAASGIDRFSRLDEESQIRLLTDIQDTDFFFNIRLFTLAGMFADPSYGGNRDRIGWDLIGFDGAFASQPPFGYYDEHYGEGERG